MTTCKDCDHIREDGGCAVWLHRKHFAFEASNCQTFTVKGIVKTMTEIVKETVKCPYPGNCLTCNAGKTGEHRPIPSLSELAQSIGAQVEEKNKAYGDWNVPGQMLRLLYPNGVPPEQIDDMLTVVRILDKLRRIATKKDAFGESPYRDIAGYSLLALKKAEQDQQLGK